MFQPMNKGHAIFEVVFFFEFSQMPIDVLTPMLASYDNLAGSLPKIDQMPSMLFNQSGNGFEMIQFPGVEWKNIRADGTPDWVVQFVPNAISVHCLEFTRWDDVWPRVYGILSTIFANASPAVSFLTAVGLRYVDRFDFNGNVADYNVRGLIRNGSPHISENVKDHGPRWHNYTGWFEEFSEIGTEALQQLNIDAVEQLDPKLQIISITHNASVRKQYSGELDKYLEFTHIENSPIATFMNAAHNSNHKLLRELLTDDMLERIGLGRAD